MYRVLSWLTFLVIGLPVAHDTGSSESDDCMDEAPPWIDWFLSLRENAFFVEVDEEFIVDRFNLTGLMSLGPHLQPAIDRIIMTEEQFFEETDAARNDVPAVIMAENDSQHEPSAEAKARREIQAAAIQLYGLIHARYLMTPRGLTKMVHVNGVKNGDLACLPNPTPSL